MGRETANRVDVAGETYRFKSPPRNLCKQMLPTRMARCKSEKLAGTGRHQRVLADRAAYAVPTRLPQPLAPQGLCLDSARAPRHFTSMRVIGYARVSTEEQATSGVSLAAQRRGRPCGASARTCRSAATRQSEAACGAPVRSRGSYAGRCNSLPAVGAVALASTLGGMGRCTLIA